MQGLRASWSSGTTVPKAKLRKTKTGWVARQEMSCHGVRLEYYGYGRTMKTAHDRLMQHAQATGAK